MLSRKAHGACVRPVGRVLGIVWLMCLVCGLGAGMPVAFAQQEEPCDDVFYDQEGQEIPVNIVPDQIGVLLREDADIEQIEPLLKELKLEIVREYEGGRYLVGAQMSFCREPLLEMARTIRERGRQWVAQAGMMLRMRDSEAPVMLTDEFIANFREGVSENQIAEINKENAVEILAPKPDVPNQYLLRVTEASPDDALVVANRYYHSDLTEAAYPNLVTDFVD